MEETLYDLDVQIVDLKVAANACGEDYSISYCNCSDPPYCKPTTYYCDTDNPGCYSHHCR